MSDTDDDLVELRTLFFEEAFEHLGAIESALLELEHRPDDRELLNQIFRGAHSIKGGSGTFGYTELRSFTHALEGLLHALRDGKVWLEEATADLLLRSTDALRGLVEATQRGEPGPETIERLLVEIQEATPKVDSSARKNAVVLEEGLFESLVPSPTPPPAGPQTFRVVFAPGPHLMRKGLDPLLVVRDLVERGRPSEVTVDTSTLPDLDALDPESCHLTWSVTLTTERSEKELRDAFAFVEDASRIEVVSLGAPTRAAEPPAQAPRVLVEERERPAAAIVEPVAPAPASAAALPRAPQKPGASTERSTVRVDTSKIDKLIDLVGEIVISQSMVKTALHDVGTVGSVERLREAVTFMDRITRELQERVMAVRMLPVGTVFSRFPRMVRDLSASLGKRASLAVSGEDVELDKGMVEKLTDPLTHLVRNAVDHGLEPPEERLAAGKPEEGTVRIAAFHEGGNVVIEVCDDGRGLPLEKIRDKARKLGLLPADVEPTVDQLHEVIFAPGFSTKEEVTDVSGRGVGMDVVKRNVMTLNGSIQFTSEPGRGSVMRIRLPLTMAIIDGLTLRIGEQMFVMPLVEIAESLRPTGSQYQTVLGRGEVVCVRDQAIPLIRLHKVLGIEGAETDPRRALVCIADTPGTPVGLLVDEILGQAQFVVKTLETNFHRIDGIMGATILGDGRVALILDIQAIARRALTASTLSNPDTEAHHGADERAA
jgi:two-component system chemotaxis sensor kinase CheA